MIQKIKNLILSNAMVLLMLTPLAVSVPFATGTAMACSSIANNVALGAQSAAGGGANSLTCSSSENFSSSSGSITSVARQIVKIFSIVVGAISILMIIYGGFRYITSGGDSNRVGGAKNTLIYAIIGLIIVALAQLIVHFVLSTATSTTSGLGT